MSRSTGEVGNLERTCGRYKVSEETFESLASLWREAHKALRWSCVFVLPPWLQVWWTTLGSGGNPCLLSVGHGDDLVGMAPLLVDGERARLMGDRNVCDYLDFIVAPGREEGFFRTLLEHLRGAGVALLDLGPVRVDSSVMTGLVPVARELGYEVTAHPEEVSLEMPLPATWDAFLLTLSGKERHEIRRKLRRLAEAGTLRYRVVEGRNEVDRDMETFLTLFAMNRTDKAVFMTGRMASFFRSLGRAMAAEGIMRLFFLHIDGIAAATVMCFDYNSKVFLYNNAYDDQFRALSVGLLCKVFSIRDSIERGRSTYDFLKGGEAYKFRLGGTPVRLYRCGVALR
jgi:CelD/BcsL family acetyltransferase involved in cellulose biosynthesis